MRIISWNVNGIRAVQKKGFLEWAITESPEILCIQETKAHPDQLSDDVKEIPGYAGYWSAAERKGYSGVATYTKPRPKKVEYGFNLDPRFDSEGRILITEYAEFTLLNIYFPNGQKDSERLQYKLDFYDAGLDFCESRRKKGEKLIICGDFNTAHNEIDLARPKENENVSGFLRVERDWMDKFESYGYIDTFRKLHPEKRDAYTWWSLRTAARDRNIGWRLDYFYVSPDLFPEVRKSEILSDAAGSDHCPILLEI